VRQKVVLDLCCGEGGAAEGYRRAGFRTIGVDIVDHSATYPGFFVKSDALVALEMFADRVDAVHTSPPCLAWTQGNAANDVSVYPNLIVAHRRALRALRKPWVMENVPRAPLLRPLLLCGTMFGLQAIDDDGTPLRLRRHRHFESSLRLRAPRDCNHDGEMPWGGVYGGARSNRDEARNVRKGGYTPAIGVAQQLLDIDFMSMAGLRKSIPPAYTEWVGSQLMEQL
jgi:DNA (cytosine-5)-methyltransferase 1